MDHECGSCSGAGCTGLCRAADAAQAEWAASEREAEWRRALNERDRLAHALRLIACGQSMPGDIARRALSEIGR